MYLHWHRLTSAALPNAEKKSRNTQRNEGFGAPKGVAAAAFGTGTQIEGGDSSGWKMASAGLGGPQFPPTKSSNFEPTPAEYT